MKQYYVYKLIDPLTDICFYVGKAHDYGYRPKGYMTLVKKSKIPNGNNYRLYCYLKYLLSLDVMYRIERIVVNTDSEALAKELELQNILHPFCNIAKCGEISSLTGRPLSDEHKQKIGLANSTKTRTLEEKQHLSECMKKEMQRRMSQSNWKAPSGYITPEGKEQGRQKLLGRISPRKGVNLSNETKEKIRQANLGKTYSEDVNKSKGRTNWTVEQDDYILSHTLNESMEYLKRTKSSIKNRKHKLNLRNLQ